LLREIGRETGVEERSLEMTEMFVKNIT